MRGHSSGPVPSSICSGSGGEVGQCSPATIPAYRHPSKYQYHHQRGWNHGALLSGIAKH